MEIKIKSILIQNFKGIKDIKIEFGGKVTNILGQNGSGKSTIADAFHWCIFNKNSKGEEKFAIRPLNENGEMIHNTDIKVIVTLTVDGKEIELSKCQRENWVKKKGAEVSTLQGNVNSFEIDGYPKSEADFKTYISELVSEDLFKMLTNPLFFVGMKWKDQRDILMRFVTDISDLELAHGNPKFADLIPELEKAPSTDDIRNKFTKALNEWKKKQVEIPVRIDELSKSLEDVDVAEKELTVKELEEQIAEIDAKIADSRKAVDSLCGESMELQFAMNELRTIANTELLCKRRTLEDARGEADKAFNTVHRSICDEESKIAENNRLLDLEEQKKPDINVRFKENQEKVFNETPYLFDESKWIFDENSTICSLCGQSLPKDKIAEIKADFESRKASAKVDLEKKLEEARTKFLADKEATKKAIWLDADKIKARIEVLSNENKSLQTQIDENRKAETEAIGKKNQIEKQLSELPTEPDMSRNAEYQQKKARYEELEKQIAGLKDSTSVVDAFKEEKKALVAELDAVKAEIAKASKNVEIEERIGELEKEQREVAQKVADQEKMLYLLEEFIREKMLKISDSINQHFNTVNFKLFEMQLNGGMKECCECTVNGVPFSTLNSGHRIVAGLDIIRSLSELYNVNAPIFVDNAESINAFNIPEMDAQMVLLSVSTDKELKVEVE